MVISYDFKILSCNVQNQHFHTLNAKFLRKQVSFYCKYHLVFHKNVLSRHCNLFVVFFLSKLFKNLGVEHRRLRKPYSRCQEKAEQETAGPWLPVCVPSHLALVFAWKHWQSLSKRSLFMTLAGKKFPKAKSVDQYIFISGGFTMLM